MRTAGVTDHHNPTQNHHHHPRRPPPTRALVVFVEKQEPSLKLKPPPATRIRPTTVECTQDPGHSDPADLFVMGADGLNPITKEAGAWSRTAGIDPHGVVSRVTEFGHLTARIALNPRYNHWSLRFFWWTRMARPTTTHRRLQGLQHRPGHPTEPSDDWPHSIDPEHQDSASSACDRNGPLSGHPWTCLYYRAGRHADRRHVSSGTSSSP